MSRDSGVTGSSVYLASIDGLRAVAMLSVVVFHGFPLALPGGYLGVDVFFVISGFLITGIIERQLLAQDFSILVFYGRRVRRIFPALILVLVATLLAGVAILSFSQAALLSRHVFAASVFVPNFMLWHETGYFDVAAQSKPLLHLWSLGVEEQFYIVWPVLIWASLRWRLKPFRLLAAITLVSLAYSSVIATSDAAAAFYSPLSRGWELGSGGLLALWKGRELSPSRANAVSLAGGLAIALAFLGVQDSHYSVSWSALAVGGTMLVITAGEASLLARHLLHHRLVTALGLVSYPLYLWHWPVLVLARTIWPQPGVLLTLALLLASLALAASTYRLAERPIQRGFTPAAASRYLVPMMIAVSLSGALLGYTNLRSLAYPRDVRQVLSYLDYDFLSDARVGRCWIDHLDKNQDFESCGFGQSGQGPKIALWGDSFAGRLYPGLSKAAEGTAQIAGYAIDGCPLLGLVADCRQASETILGKIETQHPDAVVLFGRWTSYSKSYAHGPTAEALESTVSRLKATGTVIVLVGPFPVYPGNLPDLLFDRWSRNKGMPLPNRLTSLPDAASLSIERDMRAFASRNAIRYFSLLDRLCNAEGCATTVSGNPGNLLSWDFGHLTTEGGRFLGEKLLVETLADIR